MSNKLQSSENLTPQDILCEISYFFNNFAKCQLRDDLSQNLQTIFMLFFCLNLVLLGKNLLNLILIRKLSKMKRMADMEAFNYALLPLILIQLFLYSNSFLVSLGYEGYTLSLYQFSSILQVLALNSIMAYGAYLWLLMIFKMSFNNKKRVIVEISFYICVALNSAFLFYLGLSIFLAQLTDLTWWSNFQQKAQTTLIMITLSTFMNGIFFSVGSFYASKFMKKYQTFRVANYKLVLNLALLGGVFSLIRVVQDAIQSFWSSIMILKEDSIRNNDWVYPIYIFIYMMGANFIPVAILLQRNTPIKTTQKYEESSAAIYDMQDS